MSCIRHAYLHSGFVSTPPISDHCSRYVPCLNLKHQTLPQRFPHRNQLQLTLSSSKPTVGESNEENVGDASVQDALVNILRLETTKIVVSDLAEEGKNRLIEEAKEIQANFEKEYRINMNETLRALEEASNRIMEKVDLDCTEIEQSLAASKKQLELREKEFEEYEQQILASKNFYGSASGNSDVKSLKEISRAQIEGRRVMYFVFATAMAASGLELLTAEDIDWVKLSVVGILFLAIVARLVFESEESLKKK